MLQHLCDDQVKECCKHWQTVKENQEYVMQNMDHPDLMEQARKLHDRMLETPCSVCGLIARKIAGRNEWLVEDPNDE